MFMILFVLLDFVILGVICYDLKPAYFHHYVLLQGQIQTPYASIKGEKLSSHVGFILSHL